MEDWHQEIIIHCDQQTTADIYYYLLVIYYFYCPNFAAPSKILLIAQGKNLKHYHSKFLINTVLHPGGKLQHLSANWGPKNIPKI